tara:strand:- start:1799 stop:2278 length:480 start_codon:yes stop_codon:yes gene_type:complete
MTVSFMKKRSGVKGAMLDGLDSVTVSTIKYAVFDASDIPSNFGVSSTNNRQFVLTQGYSYILVGSPCVQNGTVSFRWYDETNSQDIGFKGNLISGTAQRNLNPQYRKEAVAYISSADFAGSNITVSLRIIVDAGTPDLTFEPQFSSLGGLPCMQILRTV